MSAKKIDYIQRQGEHKLAESPNSNVPKLNTIPPTPAYNLADNSPPLALARTKRGNHQDDGKRTLKEMRREISHLGIRVFLLAAPAAAAAASPDPPLLVPAAWLLISPGATTPAAPGAEGSRSPAEAAARSGGANWASRPAAAGGLFSPAGAGR